jgi:hypothetical protein
MSEVEENRFNSSSPTVATGDSGICTRNADHDYHPVALAEKGACRPWPLLAIMRETDLPDAERKRREAMRSLMMRVQDVKSKRNVASAKRQLDSIRREEEERASPKQVQTQVSPEVHTQVSPEVHTQVSPEVHTEV